MGILRFTAFMPKLLQKLHLRQLDMREERLRSPREPSYKRLLRRIFTIARSEVNEA